MDPAKPRQTLDMLASQSKTTPDYKKTTTSGLREEMFVDGCMSVLHSDHAILRLQ